MALSSLQKYIHDNIVHSNKDAMTSLFSPIIGLSLETTMQSNFFHHTDMGITKRGLPINANRGGGVSQITFLLHKPYLVKVTTKGEGVKNTQKFDHVVYG